ncbi:GAF domain-containing protein [Frondihabitans peucedani]
MEYDAVVVLTGVGDAFELLAPLEWMGHVRALTDALKASTPPGTMITMVGIQPVSSVNVTHTKEHGLVDRWAAALNQMTQTVLLGDPRATYLAPPDIADGRLDDVDRMRFKSPAVYKSWATVLARHLVPVLVGPPPVMKSGEGSPAGTSMSPSRWTTSGTTPSGLTAAAGSNPLEVRRRLAAIHTLGILHSPPEVPLTAIVRRARDLFATQAAVFSVVTDTYQWNKAQVGLPHSQIPIAESFCATTIKTAEPLVVEDAWSDPRIAFDTLIRFYAGCPVMAPDGTRIGALCIFDTHPRDAATIDVGFLQQLAQDISDHLVTPDDTDRLTG